MADTALFKTVLCPVDFSDHSRQALAYAALPASRSKGHLVVIFAEDSMVMTRRGQGRWGPRQGSISYQVLCKANTPVLALPSDTTWMRRVVRRRV